MKNYAKFILLGVLSLASISCQEKEEEQAPKKTQGAPVLTSFDVAVAATDALCTAKWDKNGQSIIKWGAYIATSEAGLKDPNVMTVLGSEALLCNLKPATDYYVQVYATNSKGTTVSDPKAIKTKAVQSNQAVDLGLSVKWASINLGGSCPEDYGLYYFWGDTEGHSGDIGDGFNFLYETYKYFDKVPTATTKFSINKYCTIEEYGLNGYTDTLVELESTDDAAIAALGGNWRMPTNAEWKELHDKCTWKFVTREGFKGYEVSGNGNSIFLPFCGGRHDIRMLSVGSFANYWSSSLCVELPTDGQCIALGPTSISLLNERRDSGFNIRAVCK